MISTALYEALTTLILAFMLMNMTIDKYHVKYLAFAFAVTFTVFHFLYVRNNHRFKKNAEDATRQEIIKRS